MIDKTISHYRILEKLGEGGMGVVYKAEDLDLKRSAALKFLPAELTRDPDARERFIHEAQAASALDHPNICTIYEIGETTDGQMFIVMAYYSGESLKEKIEDGPIPIEIAIDIAIEVSEGLGRAHEEDIVHRDIKPANIMITKRGDVKIVDFGLAKLTGRSELTKSGTTLGTAAYMSPEQAQGAGVDHRTDIWSLGVVLYEMITGQLPFKGEYDQVMLYSIVNEEHQPITGLRTGVPMELARIVDKALAKDRNERYQSLDEMIKDLKSLTKRKGDSRRVKPTVVRRLRMSRKLFYSAVATLIVLLTLGTMYLYRFLKPNESAAIAIDTDLKPDSDKRRIAVLPFINISQNPEDEYFADGMTEELISTLSKITEIRVLARTAIMPYKKTTKTTAEIGEELQVGTLVEASVRKYANKLRITVKLVEAESQEPLWSQDYDRELKDVFAIQSEIAKQIADALKISLVSAETRRIDSKTTENLVAYTLFLKGRHEWPNHPKALQYYKQAIAKDPDYALAYAWMATTYGALGVMSYLPREEAGQKMQAAALTAIELDATLGKAYGALAGYESLYEWDWSDAEKQYKKALRLNPNDFYSHHFYANLLEWHGRHQEALKEKQIAASLHPRWPDNADRIASSLIYLGRYDEAIEKYRAMLELDPETAYKGLGSCFEQQGMIEEAIKAYQKAGAKKSLALVYARSGRESEARQLISELKESKRVWFPWTQMAQVYVALGENDEAFKWLDKAYEERSMGLLKIKVDLRFKDLHQDPRYLALLKKMGFKE